MAEAMISWNNRRSPGRTADHLEELTIFSKN